jgi:hypothetical protein
LLLPLLVETSLGRSSSFQFLDGPDVVCSTPSVIAYRIDRSKKMDEYASGADKPQEGHSDQEEAA